MESKSLFFSDHAVYAMHHSVAKLLPWARVFILLQDCLQIEKHMRKHLHVGGFAIISNPLVALINTVTFHPPSCTRVMMAFGCHPTECLSSFLQGLILNCLLAQALYTTCISLQYIFQGMLGGFHQSKRLHYNYVNLCLHNLFLRVKILSAAEN